MKLFKIDISKINKRMSISFPEDHITIIMNQIYVTREMAIWGLQMSDGIISKAIEEIEKLLSG